ncbi:MAG: response regulator transcription factor [Anaerolineae bacterium]|nr:response regulator transcription factor [Anaerolineae bacterium]
MSDSLNGNSESIQGSRLLVVDDMPDVRSGLVHILCLEGYSAEEAASGMEALRLLEQISYDLMLLDMRMPGLSGIEVMERAREMSPDMSIIILTGHATLDSAISAVKLKADNYLLKPVSAGQLVEIISHTLHERAEKLRQRQLAQVAITALHQSEQSESESETEIPLNLTISASYELIQVEPLQLDMGKGTVISEHDPDQVHALSETEAILLSCLMRHPNQVLSCRELAHMVWERDLDEVQAQNLVRPYIFRLRNKIEVFPKYPDVIRTIRKRGYLFVTQKDNL